MCTQNEVAQVIEQEFFKDGGLRDQLTEDISNAIDARIGRWLIGGGMILILAAAAAWFSLRNDVDNNTQALEDAITQDQAALLIQRLDQFEKLQADTNASIRDLDNRLRAKGI